MIGVFRSSLFRLADDVPSGVRFVVERLLCFLIVGIHASGISIPLSLLMLLEWSLIWIASLTLRVYRWGSPSINLTWFHKGRCPVSFACSETAEVCVWASRISLSCSFILSCIALPVSPIYTLPHSHGILYTTPSCLPGSRASTDRPTDRLHLKFPFSRRNWRSRSSLFPVNRRRRRELRRGS